MITSSIIDGQGTKNKVKVSDGGELNVIIHPHPPKNPDTDVLPFRQFLTTNGRATGSNDMLVDGSSVDQVFFIEALPNVDIYVKNIAVVIADQNSVLNKFGNITALTNGVKFQWVTSELGPLDIHDGMKSNFDFVQLALGQPAFGDNTTAFKAGNIISTSDGYMPVINFTQTFGFTWGLRLRRGTRDRLQFTIQDDVSGVDRFDAVGYGLLF